MGMSTEQVVEVIEAVKTEPNYWWLTLLAIIPVIVTWLLRRKK